MGKGLILIATALLLSACTTTGGSFCMVAKPMHPTQSDVEAMSPRLVNEMLAHLETGETLCGWKP